MKKNIFLSSVELFPPLSSFVIAIQSSEWIIEANENYQKSGLRNKYQIATSQGKLLMSAPLLQGKNNGKPIKEVKLSYEQNWNVQHFRTLKTNYGNSPFFPHYEESFYDFFHKKQTFLFDLCLESVELLSKLIKIKLKPSITLDFQKEYPENFLDQRTQFKENQPIKISYIPYPQVFEDRLGFIENLSVLDILFCLGPDAKNIFEKSKILYL